MLNCEIEQMMENENKNNEEPQISYDFIELPEVNSKHYYSVVMQVPRA